MSHPVAVSVTEDLHRTKLTVLFRPILAIPHLIWMAVWGIAVAVAVIISWFATLIRGATPLGLHRFIARYVRYVTQVYGYIGLLADPYPGFLGDRSYAADVRIAAPVPQNRWTTAFRMVLAIPVLILAQVLQDVWFVVLLFGWVMVLVSGAMPAGLRNIAAWILRFQAQGFAYVALLTDEYPRFDIEPHVSATPSPA